MMIRRIQRESGFALVVVIFALLLLSVIGLGMMYSTNMETRINANYRDKQTAIYAALAGLYEVRDRIQPATLNITPPTSLPAFVSTGAANTAGVVYVIADSSVDPTNPNNAYFDTELCQEQILGMTGTPGIPCESGPIVPTGKTWYQAFIDHSQSSSAPWNLNSPLDMKWTRITLKGNNMTPVAANRNVGTSSQVCWDGKHQILLPSGYGSDCAPNGGLASILMTFASAGYTSAPTVTIDAPPTAGGRTATAHTVGTTTVSGGIVVSIAVDNGGSGYTTAPAVTIGPPDAGGTQATATAVIAPTGYSVQSINLTTAGTNQCFSTLPTVSLGAPPIGGAQATAHVTFGLTKSCVYSWNPTVHCGSSGHNQTFSGVVLIGGSNNFSGTFSTDSGGHVTGTPTIQNNGTGYTVAPTTVRDGQSGRPDSGTPSLAGSCGAAVTPTAVVGYKISSLVLDSGGSGYTTAPSVTFSQAGTPSAAALATTMLSATATGGTVTGITITNPGNLYSAPPAVTIAPPAMGTAATATAAVSMENVAYTITGIVLDDPGSGYTTPPNVTISAPTGGGNTVPAATASTTVAHGTNYGKVYLLTSLGQTKSGARTMSQMEAASPVLGWMSTGALTLDGPDPTIMNMPNSNNFVVNGNDANSCTETADAAHPAIAGYDDPSADPPTNSIETIEDSLPRPDHYTGEGGTPSVENSYNGLGDTLSSPLGLYDMMQAIKQSAQTAPNGHCCGTNILFGSGPNCGSSPSSCTSYTDPLGNTTQIPKLSASSTVINYVDGDLTLSGNTDGYGILAVTGKLTMSGNFKWYGVVMVVGDGVADFGGGGNGKVVGTVLVAKIWDNHTDQNLLANLGSPTMNWNGGGGNGIQFDHCWSTNLMYNIPFNPPPSTKPLKVLSLRMLPY